MRLPQHQHDQDIQLQAGKDHTQHSGDNHGHPTPEQHALRVGLSACQVFAIDIGHDDGGQG